MKMAGCSGWWTVDFRVVGRVMVVSRPDIGESRLSIALIRCDDECRCAELTRPVRGEGDEFLRSPIRVVDRTGRCGLPCSRSVGTELGRDLPQHLPLRRLSPSSAPTKHPHGKCSVDDRQVPVPTGGITLLSRDYRRNRHKIEGRSFLVSALEHGRCPEASNGLLSGRECMRNMRLNRRQ
ncbi:hypothetical protein T440DRAFT_183372 [Plenodomus tracheiphilus IPT5]|uniref:Uncharacterized protein n=1 Tax=Plenodomus tracheiphilus IPT5 TaxID=1408161 RepID=A0A6A7AX30_9PLEO|nr:hypothetical protein T440DRAFT_183372 [Plenodomus tracheiphilus IPT5]